MILVRAQKVEELHSICWGSRKKRVSILWSGPLANESESGISEQVKMKFIFVSENERYWWISESAKFVQFM